MVSKLVVELVAHDAQVGEPDEEAGLESGLLLGFAHRLDKLPLVQLLAGDGDNAVDLLDKVHRRGVLEVGADLQQVVHVVAVQAREGGHVGTVAFALLQFVELQERRVRVFEVVLADELVVVEMREEDGVDGVVEDEAEAAFGAEIAELLVQRGFREGVLELVEIDLRVAAFPGVQQLEVRPVVFWQDGAVFGFQFAQFGGSFGIGFEACLQFGADFGVDVEILLQRAVLDVRHVVVVELVDVVLEFHDGGGVGGDDEGDILLDTHAHEHVVAGVVVGDAIDALRVGIEHLHEVGAVALGDAGDGAEDGAVGGVAFDDLAHDGEDLAAEDFRFVLDEIVEPHLGHLAVDVAEVLLGDRDPLRLRGGAGGGGVEDGLAREEDVGFAVFVAFHVGAEVLVVVHGHLLLIALVEFGIVVGFEDVGKVMLFPIDGILGVFKDISQGLRAGLAGISVSFF